MRTVRNCSYDSRLNGRTGHQARIDVARQTAKELNDRRLLRMAFVLAGATIMLVVNAIVIMLIG